MNCQSPVRGTGLGPRLESRSCCLKMLFSRMNFLLRFLPPQSKEVFLPVYQPQRKYTQHVINNRLEKDNRRPIRISFMDLNSPLPGVTCKTGGVGGGVKHLLLNT